MSGKPSSSDRYRYSARIGHQFAALVAWAACPSFMLDSQPRRSVLVISAKLSRPRPRAQAAKRVTMVMYRVQVDGPLRRPGAVGSQSLKPAMDASN